MRISRSIVISFIALVIGFLFNKPLLWLPVTFLLAGIIEVYTRAWVASPRLGQWQNFSMFIKFLMALIGFYTMAGQWACIGLLVWWFLG